METIAYTVSGVTTEISLVDMGVGLHPEMEPGTHGVSKFILPLPGNAPEVPAVIPFEAPCIIYTGRAGSGTSWSGGNKLFAGRRTDNSGDVSGSGVSSELVIEDAWYDLANITLQAVWQVITGGTTASPVYGTASWPDAVLFQATPGVTYLPLASGGHITTGQAIVEILNYAISLGVNLQVGQIDPSLYVPFYPIRCERCDQAIKYALRVHPDCATEIDYTTTPPTFNVRQRANLTALTMPYKGSSMSGGIKRTHLTSQIKPRPDLQPSRVGIYLKATGSVAGQTVVTIGTDIYPAGASGLRSFDTSIDLCGPKISQVTGQVTTKAFDPTSLTNFWNSKVTAFTAPETVPGSVSIINTAINDGSKNCITVLDESGAAVNLTTYPNLLGHQGTVHPWMNIKVIECTVTADFIHQRQKNLGTVATPIWVTTGKPNSQPHSVKIKLTNAPVGTTTYKLDQLLSTGETYPGGLAQGIYNALRLLQYQFRHTILEQPFSTVIKPGKHALNVVGGAAAWATMAAMVQATRIKFTFSPVAGIVSAETSIECGPVAHLEPGQLVALFNIFQNRDLNKINFNERVTGLPNGGMNAQMPSDMAKENTAPAEPDAGQQMFSAPDGVLTSTNTSALLHDPASAQIVHQQFVNTSATPVESGYMVPEYRNSGGPASGTLATNAYYRQYATYLDVSAGVEYFCSSPGSKTTSVWQIKSSSGMVQLKIQSDGGDYWVCRTWDGTTLGLVSLNVIKPYKLRPSTNGIGSESIRGVTYTYTYSVSGGVYSRAVSGSDGSSETDYVIPDPLSGDIIYAIPCSTAVISGILRTILSVVPATAGSGYTAGTYPVVGGTGTAAQISITVSSGVIVSATLAGIGSYSALPALTGATISGAGGTGATFNLGVAPVLVDLNVDGRAWCR